MLTEWIADVTDMKDVMKKSNLNVVDGILLELLGDYHRHLCASCDCSKTGLCKLSFYWITIKHHVKYVTKTG